MKEILKKNPNLIPPMDKNDVYAGDYFVICENKKMRQYK